MTEERDQPESEAQDQPEGATEAAKGEARDQPEDATEAAKGEAQSRVDAVLAGVTPEQPKDEAQARVDDLLAGATIPQPVTRRFRPRRGGLPPYARRAIGGRSFAVFT